MSKRDRFKRIISLGAATMLLLLLGGIFAAIWYNYYSDIIVLPFYRRGNWVLIAIYLIITIIFFKAYGGFKLGYLKQTDMLISQLISIACVDFISYFVISLIGRDFMSVPPVLLMTAADFIVITLWTIFTGKMYFRIYPPRRLVIIYGSHLAASLVLKMSQRVDKYMICESVDVNITDGDEIREMIKKYEGVIICDIPAEMRNEYLKFCFEHSIRAYIAPKISDIIIRGADDIRLFDSPLMLCRNYGLDYEQRVAKRIFDVIFSVIALVPAMPFMIISALAIKLYDRGPVFYKQKRLTRDGKEFYVYKFRSMIVDAEKNGIPQLAESQDSRITPVGRILRKFRIDEFPQLLNILKGEMSVVGPRPERPELTEEYKREMPEFEFRLKVKAGLTGYAQVYGKYNTTPYDKLQMDLMYIAHPSFLEDLRIIFATVKILFIPESTEGVAEGMKTAME